MTRHDMLLASTALSLCSYAIFKRYEPRSPACLAALLVLLPASLILLRPSRFGIIGIFSASFGIYYAMLAACTIIYRLSPWHPLARYPGPILCRLSKLYVAYISQREKQHIFFYRLHEMYGDIVRVGPNEVSIRNTDAIGPLLGPLGLPKGSFWDGRFPANGSGRSLISLRDNKEHTVRRRPWNRAFNTSAIRHYEPLINARTSQLLDILARETASVDLAKWIYYFSYDMMNDFVFGSGTVRTEMMRDGDVDGLWHQIESAQKSALFLSHVPWLGQLMFKVPYLAKARKAMMAYALKVAATRSARPGHPAHRDLFYYLFDEEGSAIRPLTKAEAFSDSLLAIAAGADTTATTITNVFYFLLTNPSAYKRLQEEIKECVDSASAYDTQAGMPYLNAVINETLRLLPPVPSGSMRGTTSETGGRMLGSYYMPIGTSVAIHCYSVHRDPRNFSRPELFLPERWLSEVERFRLEPTLFPERNSFNHNPSAFIAFSQGPLSCVGKNFAYLEMRMVVCRILARFDIRCAKEFDPSVYDDSVKDLFTMALGELPIVLDSRTV